MKGKDLIIVIILLQINFVKCIRDKSIEPKEANQVGNNQMVVYPNIGNVFYLVNYKTLRLERTIKLDTPDSIGCFGLCLSTNKDFLVFAGEQLEAPFNQFIITYDIKQDTLYNIFPTGLDSVGAPRMTAAHLPSDPGLIYLYSHKVGLYSINFLSQEVTLISSENGIPKEFHNSPDEKWIVIRKYFPGYNKNYTELEFYKTVEGLIHYDFVLNKSDQDSLDIMDLVFSNGNSKLYVSYLLSQRRAVNEAAFFGSYNLNNKEFSLSHVVLPWSWNPYYMAYCEKRKEAYMVGAQDKFYMIDTSSEDYILKSVVDLTGKIPSPSRILIRPDENVAFVSCVYSNFVLAIDLNNKSILKTIPIEAPYLMILL